MSDSHSAPELMLAEAHRFLDWARENGAQLDGTDESVFFVQGVLQSMAELDEASADPGMTAIKCLGYSVYLAELLASACRDVRVTVDAEGTGLREVIAAQEGGAMAMVLSWVRTCVDDPEGDNVVFKYAVQLDQFGEPERARALHEKLREFTAYEDS